MPLFGVLIWWVLAITLVVAALLVIHVRDIFKAALFLILAFVTVVGFFVLLRAEFLAVVQLLIYAGAISVLIIFAVMLTRDVHQGNPFNRLRVPVMTMAALLLAAIVFVVTKTAWNELPGLTETGPVQAIFNNTPGELGALLTGDFVLAVEIAAVLLVVAIIGAIALVRER